jgi:uncharacterized membrane protein YgcG
MDDAMIDLVAGEGMLRQRLEAYAESRLSPDLAATTRMRARILAVAHRQAALVRADAALAVVEPTSAVDAPAAAAAPTWPPSVASRRTAATRRTGSVLLAACLGLTIAVGSTMAAQPGGALYGARVWAETLSLPLAPRERVVAELVRLQARLSEAQAAGAAGHGEAATAALLAYEGILAAATDDALTSGDPVALAALEAGLDHNLGVLQGLLMQVPPAARPGLERALERAVERSQSSVDDIKGRGNGGGGGGGGTDSGGNGPSATEPPEPTATPKPTKTPRPAATPQPESTPEPEATPRPTRTPRATDAATPAPTAAPTPRPERTPRGPDGEGAPNSTPKGGPAAGD